MGEQAVFLMLSLMVGVMNVCVCVRVYYIAFDSRIIFYCLYHFDVFISQVMLTTVASTLISLKQYGERQPHSRSRMALQFP